MWWWIFEAVVHTSPTSLDNVEGCQRTDQVVFSLIYIGSSSVRAVLCNLYFVFPPVTSDLLRASHPSRFRFWLIAMFGWKTKGDVYFERVPSEDSEKLLSGTQRSSVDSHPPQAAHNGVSWLAAAVMVTVTAVVSGLVGAWAAQQGRLDADAFSIRHTSQHCKYNIARYLNVR